MDGSAGYIPGSCWASLTWSGWATATQLRQSHLVGLGPVSPRGAAYQRCAHGLYEKCINDRRYHMGSVSAIYLLVILDVYQRSALTIRNIVFLGFISPEVTPLMSEANGGVTETNGVSEGREPELAQGSQRVLRDSSLS